MHFLLFDNAHSTLICHYVSVTVSWMLPISPSAPTHCNSLWVVFEMWCRIIWPSRWDERNVGHRQTDGQADTKGRTGVNHTTNEMMLDGSVRVCVARWSVNGCIEVWFLKWKIKFRLRYAMDDGQANWQFFDTEQNREEHPRFWGNIAGIFEHK